MVSNNSIRTKYLRVIIISLLSMAIILGAIALSVVNALAEKDSEKILTQICAQESLRFNNELNFVKRSVDLIYNYAKDLEKLRKYDVKSKEFKDEVRKLSISISNKTDSAMAVYFRYDPELSGNGKDGFFWSRMNSTREFKAETPTDILQYNSTDKEHVGWFYEPKNSGKPIWMTPYFNKNIDTFMISYVIPYYSESGKFIGVVGMDIDFYTIVNAVGNIKLYDTGKIGIVDLSEYNVYYSDENGNVFNERLSHDFYNHVTTINKEVKLLEVYESNGNHSIICSEKLANGMILYVTVPKNDIYKDRNNLFLLIIVFALLTVICTFGFVWNSVSRIVTPLKKLAEVTSNYASGDWEESYICDTEDEVQDLSESISVMAKNTQAYIRKLSEYARRDALTGLKNKTCYYEDMEEYKRMALEFKEFAVMVLDLNSLKYVNDNYGHEAGDALIKEAGKYISKTFESSDVYRIGGDEFVAVIKDEDFIVIDALLEKFESGMGYCLKDFKMAKLSIAYGVSFVPEEGTVIDNVFKLADARMYDKKKEMKGQR